MLLIIIILFVFLMGCSKNIDGRANKNLNESDNMENKSLEIIKALQKVGKGELVGYVHSDWWIGDDEKEIILKMPNAVEELKKHISDEKAETNTRFIAAEILFSVDPAFPDKKYIDIVTKIYADKLADANTEGNCWGVPNEEAGWVEKPTRNFIKLGKPAIPHLKKLLDDGRILQYIGSEEATTGNGHKVRVKDVSAYIISKIIGKTYGIDWPEKDNDSKEMIIRNENIDKLKKEIEGY